MFDSEARAMSIWRAIGLFLVALMLVVIAVRGEGAERWSEAEREMGPLRGWLAERAGLSFPDDVEVWILEREELELVMRILSGPAGVERASKLVAMVFPGDRKTIYFNGAPGKGDVYRQGALLHELVHIAQFHMKLHEAARCMAALERDAYTLQNEWLAERGHEPVISGLTLAMRSMCPEDHL